MTGRLHEDEMKEGRSGNNAEEAQKRPGSRLFSRLRPAVAALAIMAGATVGACGTYENEGIPALTGDVGSGGSVSDGGHIEDGGEDSGTGGTDGGAGGEDAGTGGLDAGTGGMDSGTGGMDSGTGGLDAGTGGLDSGTGGMDSGTGGMDSGTGGLDAGTGGMDSGVGGSDGGMGGMDAGTGGGDAGLVCSGLGTGNFSGNIPTGGSQVVGGYTFTYVGPNAGQAELDIGCPEGALFDGYLFPEDITTNLVDNVNGKQFNITPHSVGVQTNIDIQVLNYP